MAKDSAFFDDAARLLSSAAGGLLDFSRGAEQMAAEKLEALLARYHMVTRDEFEALKARITALEADLKAKVPQ